MKEVLLDVIVQPRSSKNEVVAIYDGRLKIKLVSPPVDGKANKELCRFLAKKLGLKSSQVEIKKGHKNRRKTVLLCGIGYDSVLAKLGVI